MSGSGEFQGAWWRCWSAHRTCCHANGRAGEHFRGHPVIMANGMSFRVGTLTLAAFVLPAFLLACGSSDEGSGTKEKKIGDEPEKMVDDPSIGIDEPDQGDPPATPDPGWETILTGEWTLPPGTEGYVCARKTVDHDIYVRGIEAISPPGTHHTLLTMGEPNAEDGVTDCTVADNRTLSVFGSGVGTDRLMFPEGVAVLIPAGTQLLMNLHLFNTADEPLSGVSGQRVFAIEEAEVTDVAEGILAGTVALAIPPGETKTTTGYCTMSEDTTLIAVAPHMHTLGIYEKVTAISSIGGDVVIHDEPYDFNEQSFHLMDPLQMAKGDRVQVDCTHENTTSKMVTFGESTLSEMCFAGLYRYPATGGFFICSDEFTRSAPVANPSE
jgi:hypothetical protein